MEMDQLLLVVLLCPLFWFRQGQVLLWRLKFQKICSVVHFDFSSIPFELHDDNYVLKQMERFQNSSSHGESALGETLWHAEQSSVSHMINSTQTPQLCPPTSPLHSEVPNAHVKQEF
ncbi:hypothetical protein Droror1_Dr00021326 [Drosera rotundifolia]